MTKDGYKDSQKNPENKEELSCESNDGKYHTLIGYVKFKDGEKPKHMWFVDVHIEDTHIIDEDFYGNYYDALNQFRDYEKEIVKYNVRLKIDREIARYNKLIATTDAHKNLNKKGYNNE